MDLGEKKKKIYKIISFIFVFIKKILSHIFYFKKLTDLR